MGCAVWNTNETLLAVGVSSNKTYIYRRDGAKLTLIMKVQCRCISGGWIDNTRFVFNSRCGSNLQVYSTSTGHISDTQIDNVLLVRTHKDWVAVHGFDITGNTGYVYIVRAKQQMVGCLDGGIYVETDKPDIIENLCWSNNCDNLVAVLRDKTIVWYTLDKDGKVLTKNIVPILASAAEHVVTTKVEFVRGDAAIDMLIVNATMASFSITMSADKANFDSCILARVCNLAGGSYTICPKISAYFSTHHELYLVQFAIGMAEHIYTGISEPWRTVWTSDGSILLVTYTDGLLLAVTDTRIVADSAATRDIQSRVTSFDSADVDKSIANRIEDQLSKIKLQESMIPVGEPQPIETALRGSDIVCIMCRENPPVAAYVPCGHLCLCRECALTIVKKGDYQCPNRCKSTDIVVIYLN